MARLIYIGGYGRSGSTLLEYLLASHPEVVACGEVERHLRNFGRKKICTCGRRLTACPVWGEFSHKKGVLSGWDHERLTLALLDHVARDYAVMVDSSKTAWGSALTPFRLHQKLGNDFLLVHIVRDPRGVGWSAIRTPIGPKKASQNSGPVVRALRAVGGWMGANLACEAFGLRYPNSYLRVRYEDLVHTPREVIDQVLRRVALRAPPSLKASESVDNRHQLYGNAMRFKPISPSSLREDVAWKTAMPWGYRWLTRGLSWPLLRRYGYGNAS